MRKLISGSFAFVTVIFFCSCSRTITTRQVLGKLQTKDDLIKQLGQPDEKNRYPEVEEWVYNRDTNFVFNKQGKQDALNNSSHTVSPDSLKVNPAARYNGYIKFDIDSNSKVVGYKNNGVNLTRQEKIGFGNSILQILGGIAVIAIIIGIEIAKDRLNL